MIPKNQRSGWLPGNLTYVGPCTRWGNAELLSAVADPELGKCGPAISERPL